MWGFLCVEPPLEAKLAPKPAVPDRCSPSSAETHNQRKEMPKRSKALIVVEHRQFGLLCSRQSSRPESAVSYLDIGF